MSVAYEQKRQMKVVRSLTRLKYSLMADDEIEKFNEARAEALKNGEVLKLEVDMSEFTNETG